MERRAPWWPVWAATVTMAGFALAPGQAGAVEPATPVRDVPEYPVVDGSTSAWPLSAIMECKLTGKGYRWAHGREWSIQPTNEVADAARFKATPRLMFRSREAPPVVPLQTRHFGTGRSYLTLILQDRGLAGARLEWEIGPWSRPTNAPAASPSVSGVLTGAPHKDPGGNRLFIESPNPELLLVARRPSPDELKLAREHGVGLEARPVALDAFVFIRNATNGVANLTLDQIRAIYGGSITNWQQVGGPERAISPYQRERNSGSQETMLELVMGDRPMVPAREMLAKTMMGPINLLAKNRDGICYTFFYYQQFMARDPAIAFVAVDGVLPTTETIRDGSYPLVTPVYVVNRKGLAPGSPAAQVRDWLLSADGQAAVAESGYVPLPAGR